MTKLLLVLGLLALNSRCWRYSAYVAAGVGDSWEEEAQRAGLQMQQESHFSVLQGVVEPHSHSPDQAATPLWQLMKDSADAHASRKNLQQALLEYGQLIKHPYLLGEMPLEERYDVFLSMAKILRLMGFHQKAELILYEALGYSKTPFDAHFALGSLFLENEQLEKAKMHYKNCLFFKERDLTVLLHLAVILIAEGRIHESKFYLTRVIAALDSRLSKLSAVTNSTSSLADKDRPLSSAGFQALTLWLESLLVRVFHGQQGAIMPGELRHTRDMVNALYSWLAAGEMNGRFVFDLGASLVEGGMPAVGRALLRRGHDSSDRSEGAVSIQIIRMRIALEVSLVPSSIADLLESYLRLTEFISVDEKKDFVVDIENTMDLHWALAALPLSGLQVAPLVASLLAERFGPGLVRYDEGSRHWRQSQPRLARAGLGGKNSCTDASRVQVGIVGGHMNGHSVGLTMLHALLERLGSSRLAVTVLMLPQSNDRVSRAIAKKVQRVVHLPLDLDAAWEAVQRLSLDIALFPDWAPFPDQQSLIFWSSRLAPVQVCVFVRGLSCGAGQVDYHLFPDELLPSHLAEGEVNRGFVEQLVHIHWDILTSKSVRDLAAHSLESGGGESDFEYPANELEGRVFFAGESVALLAIDPSDLHPLMDATLLSLLRAVPRLSIVIAIHSAFLAHAPHRASWGRRLARRLWAAGGEQLAARIRLLPEPVDDARLLELFRQADVVLDTFPLSSPLQSLSAALSVGTPVVTLRSGTRLRLGREEVREVAAFVSHLPPEQRRGPTAHAIMTDPVTAVPWIPSVSPLSGFYSRNGLDALIAENTSHFVEIASRIALDKKRGYSLRVQILDLLDESEGEGAQEESSAARDIVQFLERVGCPYATERARRNQS